VRDGRLRMAQGCEKAEVPKIDVNNACEPKTCFTEVDVMSCLQGQLKVRHAQMKRSGGVMSLSHPHGYTCVNALFSDVIARAMHCVASGCTTYFLDVRACYTWHVAIWWADMQ
jgi:hypothetical protein